MFRNDEDTICALSTSPGRGAIAVLRVSGNQSLSAVTRFCPFLKNSKIQSHQVYYGFFQDFENGKKIDEVLVTYFEKGRSFTTEPSVEISCHGGLQSSYQILNLLISSGLRLAEPGEFTYRAFLNGRIDLTQAEGILSLIESQNKTMAQLSLRQIEGEGSVLLKSIEKKLIEVLAQLEANIDFSLEELEVSSLKELLKQTKSIYQEIQTLLDSYNKACLFKEGLFVALAGKPNVGKSSLFNAVLKKDRAIVTPQEGTTRDFLEETINLEGLPVTLVDTAGLRDSKDCIEQEGIKNAKAKIAKAHFIFCMFDISKNFLEADITNLLNRLNVKNFDRCLFIANKTDLNPSFNLKLFYTCIEKSFASLNIKAPGKDKCFLTSAKQKESLIPLINFLKQFITSQHQGESAVILQARHFDLLTKAQGHTKKAMTMFKEKKDLEFIAFELQEVLLNIYNILGKDFDDQILDKVFKQFCLGK
ncbi:MAG: tRNA uridine-5-carboxymethylaminomethyl(34) synthesis GTPase MnmE [Bdellovibrionaceae bacterium]|nr:tRNA uridine-5-carboxymethylaminomethyl(34) synthesis GTPase MnmE [Pseudobdellovibrionaceae bacterium]